MGSVPIIPHSTPHFPSSPSAAGDPEGAEPFLMAAGAVLEEQMNMMRQELAQLMQQGIQPEQVRACLALCGSTGGGEGGILWAVAVVGMKGGRGG